MKSAEFTEKISTELEAGGALGVYVGVALDGQGGAGYGAFFEEAAEESDSVRDAARRIELW